MKTDELRIPQSGADVGRLLDKIEYIALYADMSRREATSMRLLAEEMLSATKNIVDACDGVLWMETAPDAFTVHMRVAKPLLREDRQKFIALSKSGEAAPPKGLFARLGAALSKYLATDSEDAATDMFMDFSMYEGGMHNLHYPCCYHYLAPAPAQPAREDKPQGDMGGIEKAIIDSIVDDILVAVNSDNVEIISVKNLSPRA